MDQHGCLLWLIYPQPILYFNIIEILDIAIENAMKTSNNLIKSIFGEI